MKATTNIKTTVTYELSNQELQVICRDKGMFPEGWTHFSLNVEVAKDGNGGPGLKVILQKEEQKPTSP